VVSTTLGSIEEAITEGEHGLLVEPRDESALAGALERLLRDPELRDRLGAAARARVTERYDRKMVAPRVFEALAGAGLLNGRIS
jgi:glycosyltransferase involved in cell wall biosynthesis